LEIQAAVIAQQKHASSFPPAKRIDLFNWMIGHIGSEIRSMKPGVAQLRELYRCERACSSLYELLQKIQQDNVPDIEAVAFHIFEHIDRLENPIMPELKVIKLRAVNKVALVAILLIG